MRFLFYEGRNGERILTEHNPNAWEALQERMQQDNGMDFDEAVEEFGVDCLYGSLDYSDNARLFMDDGGEISTLYLTEVDRAGLI